MISELVFWCVMMSGSFYAAVQHDRRFEEVLPITCMSIVVVLFLFGMASLLEYGVITVVVLACMLLCCSAFQFVRCNLDEKKAICARMLTPAALLFAGYLLVFYVFGYGLLSYEWDSFSHWMDSIKAMVHIDDFVTNPMSNSMFQSYPPGMTLFQYFAQKIYLFFTPGEDFIEWRAYLSYSIFSIAMLLPFVKNLSFKKPLTILFKGSIVFLMPLRFYEGMYATVMIDPFIGILAGIGFAALMLWEQKDTLYEVFVTLVCVTLVLSKDVGLFFGGFIAVGFFLDYILRLKQKGSLSLDKATIRTMVVPVVPIISMLAAKAMWKWEIARSGARVLFGDKIKLLKYTQLFFLGNEDTYYQTSVNNFKAEFFKPLLSVFLGGKFFTISYCTLTVVLTVVLIVLCKKQIAKYFTRKVSIHVAGILLLVQLILYVYCMGATYLSNFSEEEATLLASYSRYLNMSYLAVWIVLVLGFLELLPEKMNLLFKGMLILVVLFLFLDCSTIKPLAKIGLRYNVRKSQEYRMPYEEMRELIHEQCDGDDRIYVVSQGDSGYDFWVTKFNARPNAVSAGNWNGRPDIGWSLGRTFNDNDNFTLPIPTEDLKNVLMSEYDFLAIIKVDNSFINNYGSLFEDPDEIMENSLYRVNRELGLLEKCQ